MWYRKSGRLKERGWGTGSGVWGRGGRGGCTEGPEKKNASFSVSAGETGQAASTS